MFESILLMAETIPNSLCIKPDASIPSNLRLLESGEPCLAYREAPKKPKKISPLFRRPVLELTKLKIKAFFDGELRDGPSTRWRWPLNTHPRYQCVYYNSKNGMGGYAGWNLAVINIDSTGSIGFGLSYEDSLAFEFTPSNEEICLILRQN